ncbi:hypothetical protein Lpp22_1513 [Lacticaseibacillus paracasei subsp. paracasei Lpp22]|uniref:Uncharacterized protein n=1 Tax=Lacticaseibacillus paracasei subsp. paracasei Lpp22 TaxID=1256221 RepID=A0A8E0I9K0_LACPA|nr:hypothetical protein Lpp22_1513 [Lacticaseibacillus paracasei subsp. paracasei Lpp22]
MQANSALNIAHIFSFYHNPINLLVIMEKTFMINFSFKNFKPY